MLTGRALSESSVRQAAAIGLCRTPRWRDADGETQANLERAAQQLAKAGARVSDFELPTGSEALFDRARTR